MTVASTILSQIKALDPSAMWAWGAKDFVNTGKGLQFRVGGMAKFKGLVHIRYNEGADLYEIDFIKIKKGLPVVVKTVDDVYVEDMINVIDATVQ
jgi:hypothetical protein